MVNSSPFECLARLEYGCNLTTEWPKSINHPHHVTLEAELSLKK